MKGHERKVVPQYQQIADLLRASLTDLAGQPSEALPAEQELARKHGVARGTVRNALKVLEDQGLIRRSVGRVAVTVPEGIRAWRQMRQGRRIHVIVGYMGPPGSWPAPIYDGILTAARQAGYTCTLQQMGSRFPSFRPGVRPEDPEQVLGVIGIGILDERLLAMHAEAGYPVVCVDYLSSHPLADVVMTDCFTEGQQAVEFLLRHGHREVFYLGRDFMSEVPPRERPEPDAVLMEAGYRYALRLAGLVQSVDRTRFVLPTHTDYDHLCRWIVTQQPRPTAGVIFSKVTMLKLLEAMPRHGLRCPEDLSLIGKSDKAAPHEGASVCSDGFRLGSVAVQTILARASGKQEPGLRIAVASEIHRGPTVGLAPNSDVTM